MFEFKPDYEQTKRRMEAFWACERIDRPLVQFYLAKPPDQWRALPVSRHPALADRWLDIEYQTEWALATLANQEFLGDTLPVACPNLGPEVFAAFYGCPLQFGEDTSWSEPILHDWCQADTLQLNWQHPYLMKLYELTEAFLAAGKDRFITGMPDWHPGGDCLAALRDPQNLATDMIEHVPEIKALLLRLEADYFRLYDSFYERLRAAKQPISSWLKLASEGKFYIPSNDFSIMISTRMFEEVFLPGIVRECQFLDRSIYHLDGPGALRHLDAILDISELTALQFVPGAGREGFGKWIPVYRKAQAAGKAIEVFCHLKELSQVTEVLEPNGVFLDIAGVPSREVAEHMLRQLEKWGVGHMHRVSWTSTD